MCCRVEAELRASTAAASEEVVKSAAVAVETALVAAGAEVEPRADPQEREEAAKKDVPHCLWGWKCPREPLRPMR